MTNRTNKRSAFQPSRPGEILRDDVLPAIGLSVTDAAKRLGISRQGLHEVLAGRSALSADLAARVERLGAGTARHWLALQAAHDLWAIEHVHADELSKIEKVA